MHGINTENKGKLPVLSTNCPRRQNNMLNRFEQYFIRILKYCQDILIGTISDLKKLLHTTFGLVILPKKVITHTIVKPIYYILHAESKNKQIFFCDYLY